MCSKIGHMTVENLKLDKSAEDDLVRRINIMQIICGSDVLSVET